MLKTVFWGALLVDTSLLNTYTELYQNRIKIGRVMSKILYAHIWTYAANIIDFGPLIGQISIFLNEMQKMNKIDRISVGDIQTIDFVKNIRTQ